MDHPAALVALTEAGTRYVSAMEHLASIRPCRSAWPADPPGPGYVGTRCQLLEGHDQREGTRHRHRMLGSAVTVDWDLMAEYVPAYFAALGLAVLGLWALGTWLDR